MRLIIADDHPVSCDGLCQHLRAAGFEVVAVARDGAAALEGIRKLHPDVAILDIAMPKISGLEVLRAVGRMDIKPRCFIFTGYASEDHVVDARNLGAEGYFLKSDEPPALIAAIRKEDRSFVAPGFSPSALRQIEQMRRGPGSQESPAGPHLTPREKQIAARLAEGFLEREIAQEFGTSRETVRTQIETLRRKLGVSGHRELIRRLLRERQFLGF